MRAKLKNWLKRLLALLLEPIPYGRDCYIKFIDSGTGMAYRGVFSSHAQALAAVDAGRSKYDVLNQNKAEKVAAGTEGLDNWFHIDDYPFLFWLQQQVGEVDTLLELGGSLGHFFYSSQPFADYPAKLSWIIAELPEAVALGKRVAEQRGEQRLDFIDSAGLASAPAVDLFITAGTIQYMPDELTTILASLKQLPRHVLVHRLPVLPVDSCWTLQDLGLCEVPYRLYGERVLFNALALLGYKIVATWEHQRPVNIPFYRSHSAEKYIGFYCCLD